MSKIFNNMKEFNEYVEGDNFHYKGNVVISFSLEFAGNIKAENIDAEDIKANNIDAWNVKAKNIKAKNIDKCD